MWGIFSYAANAILPLILLIILGYILKQIRLFDGVFFKNANKLVFKVCLPTLLFYNIYNISDLQSMRMDVVVYAVVLVLLLFLAGVVTAKFFITDPKQKGVILQCVFRSNYAIIGIPMAEALGGADAAATASLVSAFSIPLYNILAVISLSVYMQDSAKTDWKAVFGKIARNPLIIGVLLGAAAVGIRTVIPVNEQGDPVFTIKNQIPFVYTAIQNISRIASPLALLVLGGQFTFQAVRGMKKQIVIGTTWRLVLAPLFGLAPAVLLSSYTSVLSFGMMEYPALIALFATPVAVSSAIMAGEMENDETLAGQLVIWSSLLSIFTMFVTIVVIKMIV